MMSRGIEHALARLREAALGFEGPFRPTFHPGATEPELIAMALIARSPLPSAFAQCLRHHRAIVAAGIRQGYWIGASATGVLRLAAAPARVIANGRPIRVVPVATDGDGNAFLQCVDTFEVWFWNHHTDATRMVAHGFIEFLQRVAEDWEHAGRGEHDWRYLDAVE